MSGQGNAPVLSMQAVSAQVVGRDGSLLTTLQATDIRVEAGVILCLTGRSGAGKTSALQVALGLHRPATGLVAWHGKHLDYSDKEDLARRRNVVTGYVDQASTLLPGLTLLENMLLPAVPTGAVVSKRREARLLLRELGLHDRASHMPDQLSGGEAQRGVIGRALLMNPALLIADEPTAHLDEQNARAVIETLRARASSGMAILIASHDPLVRDAADRVQELGAAASQPTGATAVTESRRAPGSPTARPS